MNIFIVGIVIGLVLNAIGHSSLISIVVGVLVAFIYDLSHKIEILQMRIKKLEPSTVKIKKEISPQIQKEPINQSVKESKNVLAYEKIIPQEIKVTRTSATAIKREVKSEPNILEIFYNYIVNENPMVKIGVIILFFGLSFLAKYAIEENLISIEIRLAFIFALGVAFVIFGWRHRERKGGFGLILQGGGIAIVYLVIFSSAKLYNLFPLITAFFLMILVVLIAVFLAIKQNSILLALFSTVGGFIVPILTSDGSGSHVMLFSYYTLLNIGIVSTAWFKSWRILNLAGFGLTFVISSYWAKFEYVEEFFLSVELFVIIFFMLYLAVSIIFAYKQPFKLKGYVDTSLVFGLPIVSFLWQKSMLGDNHIAMAISTITITIIYAILYKILYKQEKMQLLSLSFLALAGLFFTISIAYIFDGYYVSSLWSLEALAILWIGFRSKRIYTRYAALLVQSIALLQYIKQEIMYSDEIIIYPFLNHYYLNSLIIIIPLFFSAFMYEKYKSLIKETEKYFCVSLLSVGYILWLYVGFSQTTYFDASHYMTYLTYLSISAGIITLLPKYLRYENIKLMLPLTLILGIINILFYIVSIHYVLAYLNIYIFVFLSLFYILLKFTKIEAPFEKVFHVIVAFLVTFILSHDLYYFVKSYTEIELYMYIAIVIVPMIMFELVRVFNKKSLWPISNFKELYVDIFATTLIAFMFLWWILSIRLSGASQFSYIPCLNLIDIFELIVIVNIWRLNKIANINIYNIKALTASLIFVLFTTIVIRTFSEYSDINYALYTLIPNMTLQMIISITWSSIALGIIYYAKTVKSRNLWSVGAVLLGVVIAKLFLVELSNTGSIERIISFSSVGMLIVFIGFFAPLPPKSVEKTD